MIIWDCADGFVAEIQSDEDFDAFLKTFTANDDVKRHDDDDYDIDDGWDKWEVESSRDDWDDDCDYDCGYDPYLGCFTDDC